MGSSTVGAVDVGVDQQNGASSSGSVTTTIVPTGITYCADGERESSIGPSRKVGAVTTMGRAVGVGVGAGGGEPTDGMGAGAAPLGCGTPGDAGLCCRARAAAASAAAQWGTPGCSDSTAGDPLEPHPVAMAKATSTGSTVNCPELLTRVLVRLNRPPVPAAGAPADALVIAHQVALRYRWRPPVQRSFAPNDRRHR